MNIIRSLNNALSYLSETVFRAFIFNPDQPPKVGVQPFSGDPYSEWVSESVVGTSHHSKFTTSRQ